MIGYKRNKINRHVCCNRLVYNYYLSIIKNRNYINASTYIKDYINKLRIELDLKWRMIKLPILGNLKIKGYINANVAIT